MHKRCYDSSRRDYKWYGGKGIKVCNEWQTFEGFLATKPDGWFPGATLNRKESNLDYTPQNCDWKTITAQQATRGNVKGHWKQAATVRALGAEGLSAKAIGDKLGMSQSTASRILRGIVKVEECD